jgi:uncharacterized metal-binding protein
MGSERSNYNVAVVYMTGSAHVKPDLDVAVEKFIRAGEGGSTNG